MKTSPIGARRKELNKKIAEYVASQPPEKILAGTVSAMRSLAMVGLGKCGYQPNEIEEMLKLRKEFPAPVFAYDWRKPNDAKNKNQRRAFNFFHALIHIRDYELASEQKSVSAMSIMPAR